MGKADLTVLGYSSMSPVPTAMPASATLFNTIPPSDRLGFWADQTLRSRKVADFLDLDKVDVARISNVRQSSVRFDEKIPRDVLRHLEQVAIICGLVAEYFHGDAAKTALWFRTKNPMLGELSPRDMIRYGRMEKLMQVVQDARSANDMPERNVTVRLQESAHDAPQTTPPAAAAH